MEGLTPGRIVHYVLNDVDVESINRRMENARDHYDEHVLNSNGVVLHVGNPVRMGDVFPMIITRVWNTYGMVSGQVFLDANHTYWATSVEFFEPVEGAVFKPRTWHWIPRA